MISPAVRRQVSRDTARLVDFAGSAGDFSVIDEETSEARHLLSEKMLIIAATGRCPKFCGEFLTRAEMRGST